jgi:hypothetical protein
MPKLVIFRYLFPVHLISLFLYSHFQIPKSNTQYWTWWSSLISSTSKTHCTCHSSSESHITEHKHNLSENCSYPSLTFSSSHTLIIVSLPLLDLCSLPPLNSCFPAVKISFWHPIGHAPWPFGYPNCHRSRQGLVGASTLHLSILLGFSPWD